MESLVQQGLQRDRLILRKVEAMKALTRDQIQALFFSEMGTVNGRRKSQERLLKLYEKKRLKRVRLSIDTPYIYYSNKKPGLLEHLLAVNWVYIWQTRNLKGNWEKLFHWSYENVHQTTTSVFRDDAFCGIYNNYTKKYRFQFIELDLLDNEFDKAHKYVDYYTERKYKGEWWPKLADGQFPSILIVTENSPIHILAKIKEQNNTDLVFQVKTLESIIKEVVDSGGYNNLKP